MHTLITKPHLKAVPYPDAEPDWPQVVSAVVAVTVTVAVSIARNVVFGGSRILAMFFIRAQHDQIRFPPPVGSYLELAIHNLPSIPAVHAKFQPLIQACLFPKVSSAVGGAVASALAEPKPYPSP